MVVIQNTPERLRLHLPQERSRQESGEMMRIHWGLARFWRGRPNRKSRIFGQGTFTLVEPLHYATVLLERGLFPAPITANESHEGHFGR